MCEFDSYSEPTDITIHWKALKVSYTSFFTKSTSEPIIGENSMRSYSKKMRPGREVILLTPRYYVFSLRGEIGDYKIRHCRCK
jgi:hypothetical protein